LTAGHLASAAAEGQRAKPPSPARWGRAGAAGARATERSRARAHPLVHPLPTALPPVVRSEWPRRRTVRKCMAGTCKLRPGTWERWGVAALCIAVAPSGRRPKAPAATATTSTHRGGHGAGCRAAASSTSTRVPV
jgi:hypothetical protein